MSLPGWLAAVLCFPIVAAGQSQPLSSSIVRLAPSAFHDLPGDVTSALESRGCRIPQPSAATAPENVIHGAFTGAHVSEWAVQCSIADTGRILILQQEARSRVRVVDSLERGPDAGCMQDIGNSQWGYSCRLQVLPLKVFRSWNQLAPSRIDHDAIESVFVGKSAVAYYFTRGRWHRFVTAD